MEIATFIGAIVATVLLAASIVIAGGNLLGFVDPPAALIIGGGIVCGVLISFPLDEFTRLPGVIKNAFFHSKHNVMDIIDQLVQIAEMARREGLLSLDSKIKELESDSFLASGLRMVVDGMQPTAVESILESEIESVKTRHSVGAEMVSTLGKAAPVFGLVATLMGLVLMLGNMDPETIGEKMSVALLGTFYGCVSANLFLLPFAAKLRYFNKQEIAIMELKMQGILEIQKGESPRIVKLKLLTRIPENKRPKEEDGVIDVKLVTGQTNEKTPMSKKKKDEEVEEEEVAPFWMISFSDMMSLLLSFFVLLFSMSTIEEKKMKEVMEAMGGRYLSHGPRSGDKAAPIKMPQMPKSPKSERMALIDPEPTLLIMPKPEKREIVSGVVILFALGSDQLDETAKRTLNRLAEQLRGMPHPIMIKGHASKREVDATPAYQRVDDLAFARVFNVREYLVSLGLKAELFQLVELGQFKPLQANQLIGNVADPNSYVEVIQVTTTE